MNTPDDPAEADKLVRQVRLEAARDRSWLRGGERSVAGHLAQIGVLGWMVVTPTLIGVFSGRWLDRVFHSGLSWTAPMLMLGAAIGFWSAWKWMQRA